MNCSAMTSIISKIQAPQNVYYGSNIFTSINYCTCCIFVPYGSISLYKATLPWSEFENIVEAGHENGGDVDGDGHVTSADVTEIYNYLLYDNTNYLIWVGLSGNQEYMDSMMQMMKDIDSGLIK